MSKKTQKQKNQFKVCVRKIHYDTPAEAWQAAKYFFVVYNTCYTVYGCDAQQTKKHYHLTRVTKLGDMSHFPPDVKELYSTTMQPEPRVSFWKKLRTFLIENEKEKDFS